MKALNRLSLMAVVLAAGTGFAQESVGTVTGMVKGDGGAPVAGAVITFTSPKLLQPRVTTTGQDGTFRMPLLPPGAYTVIASKQGMVGSKAEFGLAAGQTLRQTFVMKPMVVATEIVEVVSTSTAVDKTETKTATTVTAETLQALPTGSINSYGALAVAPGVTGSTSYPQIRGAVAGQTNFTINGVGVRDSVVRQGRQYELLIDDLVEDIQVMQSPMNAKNGNTSGGLVALTTKTGGNKFEGSMRIKLNKDSWGALYPRRYGRDGVRLTSTGSNVQDDALQRNYEVAISGPIIPEHLTFTYGTKLQPQTSAQFSLTNLFTNDATGFPIAGVQANTFGATPDSNVIVKGRTQNTFNMYKLFWQVNTDHQVEFNHTINKYGPSFDTLNNPGTTVDPNADFNQYYDSKLTSLSYRGIIGSTGILTVQAGKKSSAVRFSSGPGLPISTRVWYPGAETAPDYFGHPVLNAWWEGYSPFRVWTEGTTGSLDNEIRDGHTFAANFNQSLNNHIIDVGFEQLREGYFAPESFGPTNTLYYTPGITADNRYMVWNFWASGIYQDAFVMQYLINNAYSAVAPEMRELTSSDNPTAKSTWTTNSVYVNDLWTINQHWSVMGGVRYDQWKVKDRSGDRVSSSGISPRTMVRYDVRGDNVHLLTFGYNWYRSTLSNGSMGAAIRVPGNLIVRSFWNVGNVQPYFVDKATLYQASNYKEYTYSNSDVDRDMNPNLRPDRAVETTLEYKRAFENGGFVRITAVHRQVKDLLYSQGDPTRIVLPAQFMGWNFTVTPNTFKRTLTFDPNAKREHRGLELEWEYPIYRKAGNSLVLRGNWTINRDYGREQWREGNVGDNAPRFDAQYQAMGIPFDLYNPEGEIGASIHNIFRSYLTWSLSSQRGVRNDVTLMGTFSSGAPWSAATPYRFPTGQTLGTATGLPTNFNAFIGGRGRFYNPETFSFDLQWNLSIPIVRKVVFTSYLTVNNLFNQHLPGNIFADALPATGATNYNPAVGAVYKVDSANIWRYGRTNGLVGARGVMLDLGIKF